MENSVIDLRSALALLERTPGQLISTDVEVDPSAELAGFIVILVQVVQ